MREFARDFAWPSSIYLQPIFGDRGSTCSRKIALILENQFRKHSEVNVATRYDYADARTILDLSFLDHFLEAGDA